MTTMTATRRGDTGFDCMGAGAQVPYEAVHEPGCYISNWTGHLIRIPGDALPSGRSPSMDIVGTGPLVLTKISDDPFIPLSKARTLAADHDARVNF